MESKYTETFEIKIEDGAEWQTLKLSKYYNNGYMDIILTSNNQEITFVCDGNDLSKLINFLERSL